MSAYDRALGLIVRPREEWDAIDREPGTALEIFTAYVIPLAAIPPISFFVGFSLVGSPGAGAASRVPLAIGVAHMVSLYVLTLALVWAFAAIMSALAPHFGGVRDGTRAFKVAAHAPTAAWAAGIFYAIPALSILGIVGLYSLYLLYVGLPRLMRVPDDKALPYTVVAVMIAVFLTIFANALAALMIPSQLRGF